MKVWLESSCGWPTKGSAALAVAALPEEEFLAKSALTFSFTTLPALLLPPLCSVSVS